MVRLETEDIPQKNKSFEKQPQKEALKPRVEKKAVVDTVLELKFKLQCKGFYSNQIQDFFFKPYQAES